VGAATERLKQAVRRTFDDATQRRLRRGYVTARVLVGVGRREREMGALASIVRAGDRVVDIGANVGIYTKALSRLVGPNGRVYSFEPVSDNYEILRAVARMGRLSNVVTFRLALGSRQGEVEMVVPEAANFGGYYTAHVAGEGDQGRRERVPVQTLDTLHRQGPLTRVDFVKCDVEGAEVEVLTGGSELFARQRPSCLIEIDRRTARDVFSRFAALGYRSFVFDGSFVPVGGFQGRKVSKYVFIHPSRPAGPRR
jgi:FkbM family methyltransferase